MTALRAVLVGVVVAAAMVVAIRRLPVEEQKADAAISIETLRGVGLMRAAAVIAPPKAEKPMVLPPLEPWPKAVLPARPAPPKVAPAKPRPLRVVEVCAAHGFRRIQHGLSWHCSRW